MLQALEEGKFNQLPGGIFNKGFVRAYSRCVGLDEDQTVAEYLQASGDAPPPKTEPGGHEDGERKNEARENEQNVRRLEAIGDAPPRQLPWGLFAAFLLVIALALSIWSHRERERARQSVRPTPTTATAPSPGAAGGASSRGAAGGEVVKPDSGARSPTSGSSTNGAPMPRQNPPPPQLRASLRSSFTPAKTPGSRSPPTAKLSSTNFWPLTASARSKAVKKSSSRLETPVASTFASTERNSKPGGRPARSRPLLLVLEECYRAPHRRLRRLNLVSFFSSIYSPPSTVQCRFGPTQCQHPPVLPIPLRLGGHLCYRFHED